MLFLSPAETGPPHLPGSVGRPVPERDGGLLAKPRSGPATAWPVACGAADKVDLTGFSVASAGDVNGDGLPNLITGAAGADPHGSGASYVVFGKDTGFAANLDLSTLNGSTGFQISGGAVTRRGSPPLVAALLGQTVAVSAKCEPVKRYPGSLLLEEFGRSSTSTPATKSGSPGLWMRTALSSRVSVAVRRYFGKASLDRSVELLRAESDSLGSSLFAVGDKSW